MKIVIERIRAGLYRVINATCECGGELRIDRRGNRGEFLWESFCAKCKVCDCNGWGTLEGCRRTIVEYFNAKAVPP